MKWCVTWATGIVIAALTAGATSSQPAWPADHGEPGDEMIQHYLRQETDRIQARFLDNVGSADDWRQQRPRRRQEYLYMLGLDPLPPRTPLQATITGTVAGDGFLVDMIHYQSRPRLYVTGNLYRPAGARAGERFPAVLYVCGHASNPRHGGKTVFQPFGIWFARHGYVCLVIDTVQRGEIAGVHRGTYQEKRWWWLSRGYTPAGVECWNGVRGIDYLTHRPDVDPERIGVTGASGGGAYSFYIAAADERVKVAVPVSGMSDLPAYVAERAINGHCDCMFMHNAFGWPWEYVAALVAPRPVLLVDSDEDRLFLLAGHERIINRLELIYGLLGAGDMVDGLVSTGGHGYRRDIRQATYRFINTHLKNDPRVVSDSEVDLINDEKNHDTWPIHPGKLRVFPEDTDIPADQLNTTIDEHFVPVAQVPPAAAGQFGPWKDSLVSELRRVSFASWPESIPPARLGPPLSLREEGSKVQAASEDGIVFEARVLKAAPADRPPRITLVVADAEMPQQAPDWLLPLIAQDDVVCVCFPRGVAATRWTRKNPPNYVERAHALLGRTADTGRVCDVIAFACAVRDHVDGKVPIHLVGRSAAGIIATYAALWEPDIAAVTVVDPPMSHMEEDAPPILNVLRACDIPEVLGLLAPRPLRIIGGKGEGVTRVEAIYTAAGAPDRLTRE